LESSPLKQAAELSLLPHASVEEGPVQGYWSEEGYSQDRDGAPLGCDDGVECPLIGCSVRDLVSLHPAAEL
jgi:hypothetical protein